MPDRALPRRITLILAVALEIAAVPVPAPALTLPAGTWVSQPSPIQSLLPGRSGYYDPRGWNSLRYDAVSGTMLLFDGYVEPPDYPIANIYANSIWRYDVVRNRLSLVKLSRWTRVNGVTVPLSSNASDPTPYDRHPYGGFAFVPSKNRAYLWGGANSSVQANHLGDTWSYDVATGGWRQVTASVPYTVFEQAMSFDSYVGKLVLFAGASTDFGTGSKTYLFDPGTERWSLTAPPSSPAPRFGQSVCFDPVRHVTWMFGGGPYEQAGRELWTFDAAAVRWTRISETSPWPSDRRFANMAYDTNHGIILLWGGVTASDQPLKDTWIFEPSTRIWKPLPIQGPPGVCTYSNGVDYDPRNDVFVMNLDGAFWLYRYAPGGGLTGVDDGDASDGSASETGSDLQLRLRSLNPVSGGGATFEFTLPRAGSARVEVFDSSGRRIDLLADGWYAAGAHTVSWTASLRRGTLASGVYFVKLYASDHVATRRFVLVR